MAIPNRFRKSVISRSFSLKTHKNENSNNFPKLLLSGEVLKENFTDTFYTNLEVIAFSLFSSFPYKANFFTDLTDLFQKSAVLTDASPTLNSRKIPEEKLSLLSSKAYDAPKVKSFNSVVRTQFRFGLRSKLSLVSLRDSLLHKLSHSVPRVREVRGNSKISQSRTSNTSRTKLRFLRTYRRMQSNEKNNNKKKNYSLFLAKSKKDKNPDFSSANTHASLRESLLVPCYARQANAVRKPLRSEASERGLFKKTVSLNIQIGDYVASGDKVGSLQYSDSLRTKAKKPLKMYSSTLCIYKPSRTKRSFVMPHLHHVRNASRDASDASRDRGQLFFKRILRTTILKAVRNHCQASTRTRTPKINDIQNTHENHFSLPIIIPSSGRVLTISKTQIVVQKTQPVLFYDSARIHVKRGEWVKEGTPILTLTHQTLITGDIVQGIPRIEQLFEAFTSPPPGIKEKKGIAQSKFKNVHDTLHSQVRDIFRKYWLKNVLPIAVRKSLEEIQYNIVEMIQKVYLSQGVLIADKHIEIIIRQMTSKGQILDSGSTGLLLEEVLPIRQIENANITTPGKKCLYVPAVVGLTTAALTCDSFISAASFQETTRVLSRDAVVGKSDFLRGLKEKVVIGDLISAGTGLDIYFIYNLFAEAIS